MCLIGQIFQGIKEVTLNQGEMKGEIILVDPMCSLRSVHLRGEKEILIPGREIYSGSPVAFREPIALEYIAAYLEKNDYNCTILSGNVEEEYFSGLRSHLKKSPLALLLSIHSTFLVPSAVQIARSWRRIFGQAPIIVGGYHPTGAPEIVLEDCFDFAVIGEGEKTVRFLLDSIREARSTLSLPGVAQKGKDGKLTVNESPGRLKFSELPWPKRSGEILNQCSPGPLSYPAAGRVAQISYSRGCPYRCEFCVSPKVWGPEVHYRRAADVVDEMEDLVERFGVNAFFFADLTFNLGKAKVIELCDAIRKSEVLGSIGDNFGWHAMCEVLGSDLTMLKQMATSGCSKIDFGIESFNNNTLERIKPRQGLIDTKQALEAANEAGILTRALLMVGYEWETKESIREVAQIAISLPVDQLRIAYYVPFPGTAAYSRLKDRLFTDYEAFTTDTPAFEPDSMKADELKKEVKRAIVQFYNSPGYFKHVSSKVSKHPRLKKSFKRFFGYLRDNKMLSSGSQEMLKGIAD
jgi:anaerobic magnesium-protoporphyrin IX monomethyl ester cyclase